VDHSLVQPWTVDSMGEQEEAGQGVEERGSEGRFRLLYVVREYALERLEASRETEALRRAHVAYYLGLVEERAFAMYGPEAAAWMEQLEREHDNFRAALAWARERGELELGLRLAAVLGLFWYTRGYFTEGRGWLEGLLALAHAAEAEAWEGDDDGTRAPGVAGLAGVSVAARAKALAVVSNFALVQGDGARALAAAEEALALARGQQAGWAAGVALYVLGLIALAQGELEQATAYVEESVAQLRAVGEPVIAAVYLNLVGLIALDRGDLERATACGEESLAFAKRTGADHPAGAALACLAAVARLRGDLASAERLGREQLLVWRRLSAPNYLAGNLEGLALTAAAAAGKGARADRVARLLGAAAALRERVGAWEGPRRRVEIERAAASARAALGEEQWAAAYAVVRPVFVAVVALSVPLFDDARPAFSQGANNAVRFAAHLVSSWSFSKKSITSSVE
jgi:hypothetical protein